MKKKPTVVAIVNTNPDLISMLRVALEQAGFVVFSLHISSIKHGAADTEAILREHDPRVIVYDVVPPYEPNWRFLDHLRNTPGFKGRRFVLTSVNARRVAEIVGTDESVYEVIGQVEDIAEIVRAVKEASRARDTR